MNSSSRLALSWVNKDRSLATTDAAGYEWVDRRDPRVSEIRLLRETDTVGEVSLGPTADDDNLLVVGDSLHALRAISELPAYVDQYVGKVKLIYIDPPFNTGQAFEHYDDALEHSVWLTMMRDRLQLLRNLLTPDGSLWVHLDDSEMAYCKVLLDEIFGRYNFVSTIVWETDQGRRNDTAISTVQDYILVYARDKDAWRVTRNLLPRTAEQTKRYRNPDNDPRGPWLQWADSTARSGTESLKYPITLPSGRVVTPPSGVYWRFSQETFNRALAENRVYFGRDGDSMPVVKRYLSEVQDGVVPRTWWPAAEVGSNMSAKRDHLRRLFPGVAAFATPKPEKLLHRVISIASNPGDIVLDCFAGSGTTAAVAHKMGRRWVAVEREASTVETFTRPRLEKVIDGEDPYGVTEETKWEKGGGFRILEVAPSIYDYVDGRVFLAESVSEERFAEAVCAQLGFVEDRSSYFVGSKGRTRLAVINGVADELVVQGLIARLDEDECAVIAAKAITDDASRVLKELSPGSRLKKVPQDLIAPKGRILR